MISKVFLSSEKQNFGQIPSVDPESNQQTYTSANYYNSTAFGLSETFIYNPFSWWKSTTQAIVSYLSGKFNEGFADLGEPNHHLNLQFYTNHNLYLNKNKTLQAGITFTYSPVLETLMYKVTPFSSLDMSINAFFLDKKLEATLAVQDVFKNRQIEGTTFTNGIKQVYGNYNDNRSLNLSVSYRFGNDKLHSKSRESHDKKIKQRTI